MEQISLLAQKWWILKVSRVFLSVSVHFFFQRLWNIVFSMNCILFLFTIFFAQFLFPDFQTYVQRFSDGSDLEVRWEASNNNGFTVQLDNDVPDGFTDVAVQCGGTEQRACKAYFTNLKADASYKAKVIKENTVVSFTTPATAGELQG